LAADQRFISSSFSNPYELYFTLLSRVMTIKEKPESINEMLISDANAALFAVQVMSFGNKYDFTYQCENCKSKENGTLDLMELEVRYSDSPSEDPSEEPAPFDANSNEFRTRSGKVINFALPRLSHEKEVARFVRDRKKKNQSEDISPSVEMQYARIAFLVNEIEGLSEVQNKSAIAKFNHLLEMEWDDYNNLVAAIGQADVGIRTNSIPAICKSCGWENEPRLVLDENFFRSSKRK
jgi:hypothetical protein